MFKGFNMKILHFSDTHIHKPIHHMHWMKWFSKRGIGAINLLRGRARYFDDAQIKLQALVAFKEAQDIDLVIHTGDYTALGLESELILARKLIDPLMHPPQRYLTVPGNHDIYVHEGDSHYRFSEQFCSVLQNDLPEYCRKGPYPLVRLIGNDVAVIAVNSARPNPWPWRSDGHIPSQQLAGLKELLADERVKNRFIFIITHYAPRLENGKPDKKLHGLSNADDFLKICSTVTHGAILFGHIHKTYQLSLDNLACDLFCAGSATMQGHEGLWVYTLKDKKLHPKRVLWDGERYCFTS